MRIQIRNPASTSLALHVLYQEAAGEEEEEDDLERSAQNTSQGSGEANKVSFLKLSAHS
jgi:hypothetical protein